MTEAFGAALKELRQAKGIPLTEVARRSGLARSHLNRLEAGESSSPSRNTLNALALALGVPPGQLFEMSWEHNLVGPGLPGFRTYLRGKFGLSEEEITRLERSFRRITGAQPGSSSRNDHEP